MGNPQYGLRML